MKKRIITTVLAVVLVFALSVSVYAKCGNHNNGKCIEFPGGVITQYAPTYLDEWREKNTSNSVFFYPKGNLDVVAVTVWGAHDEDGTGRAGFTRKDGQDVDYVMCYIDTKYRIRNHVKEEKNDYCRISVFPTVFSGRIEGCWNPDYEVETVVEP